jgi:hypothetical protein
MQKYDESQRRQSTKLFLQSFELGPPATPPPPTVSGGGRDTLACGRGGGGVPIRTRGQTLWCSRNICTLCDEFLSFSASFERGWDILFLLLLN